MSQFKVGDRVVVDIPGLFNKGSIIDHNGFEDPETTVCVVYDDCTEDCVDIGPWIEHEATAGSPLSKALK